MLIVPNTLVVPSSFLFRIPFRFFESGPVGKGDISFDLSVVQRIDHSVFQIAEELFHVDNTAYREPNGGDDRRASRNGEVHCEEIVPPPLRFPRGIEVPNDHQHESDCKLVNE